jgi:hypothetical protein
MDDEKQLAEERYVMSVTAIAACVAAGVDDRYVLHLCHECGLDRRDVEVIMKFNQRKAA